MSIGNSSEMLSQRIVVGIILVGRLGVLGTHAAVLKCLFGTGLLAQWYLAYLVGTVPSPPEKSSFQNCPSGILPRSAGKNKTRYPLV